MLRSFARSRGESICEASVSRTFAEPTIIDLGRGLRVAVVRGFRGTEWAFGSSALIIESGRAASLLGFVL
jgi:hypothetical protein